MYIFLDSFNHQVIQIPYLYAMQHTEQFSKEINDGINYYDVVKIELQPTGLDEA